MITLYRVFLVVMIAMSGAMLPEALTLPRDSQYTIGPGFMPIIMLGTIIACCVLLLVLDFVKKSDAKVKKDAYVRLLAYVLGTVLLVFCMENVGIALSVCIYLFCMSKFVEKHSWLDSAKTALITTIVIYLIFHTWLQVPMTICNFF